MPTRRTLLTLVAAAAASACTALPAHAVGSLVDVQIVDRSRGETLPTYRSRGASYVAGRPGDRYAIRLTNRSGGRVLVVLSVDGINAVSGETAAVGQTGYVLSPWETAEITGWRKSYAEAAAFYFTALPDSYAARTDRPGNVGVIGAALFRERPAEARGRGFEPSPPIAKSERAETRERADPGQRGERADRAQEPERRAAQRSAEKAAQADLGGAAQADSLVRAPSPSTPAPAPRDERESFARERKLGTGHGEREFSPATQTTFERATVQPAEIVQVRYDSHPNLLASGVIVRPRMIPSQPQAFPGFAADPL